MTCRFRFVHRHGFHSHPRSRCDLSPFPSRRLEKLELLRQNVSSQHEVQRLRDREMELQADLNTASREIHRLRDGFVTSVVAAKSRQESCSRSNETSLTQIMEIFTS